MYYLLEEWIIYAGYNSVQEFLYVKKIHREKYRNAFSKSDMLTSINGFSETTHSWLTKNPSYRYHYSIISK